LEVLVEPDRGRADVRTEIEDQVEVVVGEGAVFLRAAGETDGAARVPRSPRAYACYASASSVSLAASQQEPSLLAFVLAREETRER
jgi:hypothetical protein